MVAEEALLFARDEGTLIARRANPYVNEALRLDVGSGSLFELCASFYYKNNLLMLILIDKFRSIKRQMFSIKEYHKTENFGKFSFYVIVFMLKFEVGKFVS